VKFKAFTLAELLIALLILGVIATFTIPKVLTAQQNGKFKAAAKETAAMISGAYSAYYLNQAVSSTTRNLDLTQYMNYVSVRTSSTVDYIQGGTTATCSTSNPCIKLHNGGTLWMENMSFGGTQSTNAIWFLFDPEDGYSNTTTQNKSVYFTLYYSGRLTTWQNINPNTVSSLYTDNPLPGSDPTWFSWN